MKIDVYKVAKMFKIFGSENSWDEKYLKKRILHASKCLNQDRSCLKLNKAQKLLL